MIYTFIILLSAINNFATPKPLVDLYSADKLRGIETELSTSGSRFAGRDLAKYGNHYTMMAYRSATGSSEIHEHEADIFLIQDGQATIVTGGKMIGGHLQKAGEWRGVSIEGGERQTLHAGDVIHIPAGVPHQLLVTREKPISYFVVKVSGQ